MSNDSSQDKDVKTEKPSEKRLEDALRKGNVMVSKDVYNFFIILSLVFFVIIFLPKLCKKSAYYLRGFIANIWDSSFIYGSI